VINRPLTTSQNLFMTDAEKEVKLGSALRRLVPSKSRSLADYRPPRNDKRWLVSALSDPRSSAGRCGLAALLFRRSSFLLSTRRLRRQRVLTCVPLDRRGGN